MKEKIKNIIFLIGFTLASISGILMIIYEYVIWDKSFIPKEIFILVCVLGLIGIAFIVLWIFLQKKKK